MSARRTATPDTALDARVSSCTPLRYEEGPDPALDRPGHVRAGSGLAWVGDRVALVQDDANFLALVDPTGRRTRAVALPAGAGGRRQFDDARGNKRDKLDLEACVALEHEGRTLLLAFGSGSSPRREQVLVVDGWESGEPAARLVHVPALYAALRREAAFAGSELNVEGAVEMADGIQLFARGNGAPREGRLPLDATCRLERAALLAHLLAPDRSPPPTPAAVVRYVLGTLDGVPLGFTDATSWRDGAVLFAAAAEDSPDATRDGRVTGSVIGVIAADGRTRWTPLRDAQGAPFAGKVEGLVPARDGSERLYVVTDADDPDAPSTLCTVELRGPWLAARP